jgi:hypothetical protein
MEDDSLRMQAIGQSGELGEEIYPALDGWIKWDGGDCPVGYGDIVEIQCRDGERETRTGESFSWSHRVIHEANIIAYRIHKES